MIVMTEEEFLTSKDAAFNFGDSALHKSNSSVGKRPRAAQLKRQSDLDTELIEKREKLRKEYAQLIKKGDIRPPTRQEKLQTIASGHPDLESTKAAKRILAKASKSLN